MILPVSPVSRRDWTALNFGTAKKWVSKLPGLSLRATAKMCCKQTHLLTEQFNPHTKGIACNIANNCTHITCLSLSTQGGMSPLYHVQLCHRAMKQLLIFSTTIWLWLLLRNRKGWESASTPDDENWYLPPPRWMEMGETRLVKNLSHSFFCDRTLEVMKTVGTEKKCLILT